ncbi:MAG: AAA family ATPase [Gammaproteobacteria bacterium]
MAVALETIADIVRRGEELHRKAKEVHFHPNGMKRLDKKYSITETSALVGRTPQAIRDAEGRGELPQCPRDEKNRRVGYSLGALNFMRDRFGTRPTRNPQEDPVVTVAIQNFKGGVGKTTVAVNIAQYLARAGMRVLLVDCDSQASTTQMFGYIPDLDIDEDETLYPFLMGERRDPGYAIRKTYWDGLKLIPANLSVYGAEYAMAAQVRGGDGNSSIWFRLRNGLLAISDDFDCIILDPPPALGMISLNVLYAATGLIAPMPPAMLDFSSTLQFFTMLHEVMSTIGERDAIGRNLEYGFIRILISRKKQRTQESGTAQDAIVELAREFYGRYVMSSTLYDSAEIEAASAERRTVYELDGPTSSHRTYRRALETLDSVGREVQEFVQNMWPSYRRQQELMATG